MFEFVFFLQQASEPSNSITDTVKNPIVIAAVFGFLGLLSSRALELLGYSRGRKDKVSDAAAASIADERKQYQQEAGDFRREMLEELKMMRDEVGILKVENLELRVEQSRLRAENLELRTENAVLRAQLREMREDMNKASRSTETSVTTKVTEGPAK